MEFGDSSDVSSVFAQLASISPSTEGATLLNEDGSSYGPSSSNSSTSPIGQLLESVQPDSSNSSGSILSALA